MGEPDASELPTAAGIYDYGLGGVNNTAADRAASERVKKLMPEIAESAWANRGFLQRAVARMVRQWGIRQFLDIGSGFPTQRNTHQVVAEAIPDGRVVYVDNDPRVVARSSELLGDAAGTAIVEADLRRPDDILAHPQTRRLIDFGQPLGLLLVGVTHVMPDADDPWGHVSRYVDAMASGSYLALSAITSDYYAAHINEAVREVMAKFGGQQRTRSEIERFFTGLEIMPPYPGAAPELTFVGLWGAEDAAQADDDGSRFLYAAVARKP
jgi:hypothetical protein